jgi:hypothetical protein
MQIQFDATEFAGVHKKFISCDKVTETIVYENVIIRQLNNIMQNIAIFFMGTFKVVTYTFGVTCQSVGKAG